MPADYEMLISHSPPVFSHSPPSNFLTNYAPYRLQCDNYARTIARGPYRPYPPNSLSFHAAARPEPRIAETPTPPTSPIRPCLVSRAEEDEHGRGKKKVVFADDRGMSLTQVRVMSEPSCVPPLWSSRFLAQVTKGLSAEVAPEPWEVTFAQPASDYVLFRRKLDHDMVSLENVIVKESEECVLGTIKVKNLAFRKEVIVRSTDDEWKTHQDTFCKFVDNNPPSKGGGGGGGGASPHYVLYDTFSFRLTLPPKSKKIEFCVCFRCDDTEHWDNNAGANYVLLKKVFGVVGKSRTGPVDDPPRDASDADGPPLKGVRCADALQAKMDSWSEFASWTHLENDTPYW